MSKSIVNSNYLEFAKRLTNTAGDDYTILGPGAIMAAVFNDMLKPILLVESFKRGFMQVHEVIGRLDSDVSLRKDIYEFGIDQLFGPKGLIERHPMIAPKGGKVGRLFMRNDLPASYFEMITLSAYKQVIIDRHKKLIKRSKAAMIQLIP